jgi:hypothetical protein
MNRDQLVENLLQAIAEDIECDGLMAFLADGHPIMEAYKALVAHDQDKAKG